LAQINLVGIGLENEPEPVKTKTPKLEQKPRKIYDDSFITPTIDIELPSTNGKKVIPAGGMFAIDL
jgi:hypothetical protein